MLCARFRLLAVGLLVLIAHAPLPAVAQPGPAQATPAALPPDAEVVVRFGNDGPWRVQYRLELPAPDAAVIISLVGFDGDLDLFVRANQGIGNPKDADHASTSRTDAEVVTLTQQSDGQPRPQVYYVMVENVSQRAATGRLMVRTVRPAGVEEGGTPVSPDPTTPSEARLLTPGMRVDGALGPDSRRFRDNRPGDRYRFVGTRGQLVELVVRSFDFDTVLVMRGPDGREFTDDDGVPNGSRIYMALPVGGEYEVICTSYAPGEAGRYSLDFTLREAEVHQLSGGDSVNLHLGGSARIQYRIDVEEDWQRLQLQVTGATADTDIYARYSVPFNEIELLDGQAEFWVNEEEQNETLTLETRDGALRRGTLYVVVLNYDDVPTDATFRVIAVRPGPPVRLEPGVETDLDGTSLATLDIHVPEGATRCLLGLKHQPFDLQHLHAGPEPVGFRPAPFGSLATFRVAAGTDLRLRAMAGQLDAAVVRFFDSGPPKLDDGSTTVTFTGTMFGRAGVVGAVRSLAEPTRLSVSIDSGPGAEVFIAREDGVVAPVQPTGPATWSARLEPGDWVVDVWVPAAMDGREAQLTLASEPWQPVDLQPDVPQTVRMVRGDYEDFLIRPEPGREKLEIHVTAPDTYVAVYGWGDGSDEGEPSWYAEASGEISMVITRWTGRPLPDDAPIRLRVHHQGQAPCDVIVAVRSGPLIDAVATVGAPAMVILPPSRMAQVAVDLPPGEAARIRVIGGEDSHVLLRSMQPFRRFSADEMESQFAGEALLDAFTEPPFVSGGQVYLLIIGAAGDDLEVICEPAAGRQPTVLEPGTHEQRIEDVTDATMFAINARAGQRLTITVNSEDLDPMITLTGPGGEQWQNDDANSGTTNSRLQITAPADGRYILRVKSFDERRGTIRLYLEVSDE